MAGDWAGASLGTDTCFGEEEVFTVAPFGAAYAVVGVVTWASVLVRGCRANVGE
jgi:hypothetical protein